MKSRRGASAEAKNIWHSKFQPRLQLTEVESTRCLTRGFDRGFDVVPDTSGKSAVSDVLAPETPLHQQEPTPCSAHSPTSNHANWRRKSSTSPSSSRQRSCYGRVSPSPPTHLRPSSWYSRAAWNQHFNEETCYSCGTEDKRRKWERSWSTTSEGKTSRSYTG